MVGDGPDRLAVERQVADAGLADVVDFVGEQHDIVSWLSVADLFLLPSAQESFGLAALEAMSCEVPVIASRVGGLPEVIEDGVTGFICDPDDVEGMADARHSAPVGSRVEPPDRPGRRGRCGAAVLHERRGAEVRAVRRRRAGGRVP